MNPVAGPLGPFAAWLHAAGRMRIYTSAFIAGAIASAALAPYHLLPALLVSFTAAVWLLDYTKNWRSAAVIGWWFGFGFFISGLYWIGFALLVDAENFAHFIPLAALVLPGGLAVFIACAFAGAKFFWRAGSLSRIGVFAISWSAFEWLRGHVFTGFPWNLIGYAWSSDTSWMLAVLQSTSVIGIYGLSLLTVLLAALPAALVNSRSGLREYIALTVIGVIGPLAIWFYGAERLAQPAPGEVAGVSLRIVQPNITQSNKWLPEQRTEIFQHLIRLSSAPSATPLTHAIWPEAATPFFVAQSEAALTMMSRLVTPMGAVITGAPRQATPGDPHTSIYNSVLVVDGDARVTDYYDKSHLVPFGEYLPFPEILARIGLKKLTVDLGAFASGPGVRSLKAPGIPPFSALVCYEIIFPGWVMDANDRPGWLLNVTNDAWYGDTSGPPQHLAQARVRAIEEGLPLVRAANTGISALFDAHGRTLANLPLNSEGVIDHGLPNALPPTVYSTHGDRIYLVLLLLIGVVSGAYHQFRPVPHSQQH